MAVVPNTRMLPRGPIGAHHDEPTAARHDEGAVKTFAKHRRCRTVLPGADSFCLTRHVSVAVLASSSPGRGSRSGTSLGAVANWLLLRVVFRRVVGPLPVPKRAARLGALVVGNAVLAGVARGGYWGAAELLPRLGLLMTRVLVLAPVLIVVIGAAFMAYARVLCGLGYRGGQPWSMPGRIFERLRRSSA